MNITADQRKTLEEYFDNIGLNEHEQDILFEHIRYGGNAECPLMIEGYECTGKSMLTTILKQFGVHVLSPHECQSIYLKKRVDYANDESRKYVHAIFDKLGIRNRR